jgi:uncharacterized membrane protein YfcA
MRTLIAFVCVGMMAAVAGVLVVVQELLRLLPLILTVLVVVYLKRRWDNRRAARPAPPQRQTRAYVTGTRSPGPPPIPGRPGGWVMVPVWMPPAPQPAPRPVIDAEVISEDTGRRGR